MPEMTLIPIWREEDEQTGFANVIRVKCARVRDLDGEERAALRKVYQRARERFGPNKDNWSSVSTAPRSTLTLGKDINAAY